jgi:hypothetical protein
MTGAEADDFRTVSHDGLEGWAADRAQSAGLAIDGTWLPAVLENLTVIQAHSKRVAAALDDEGPDAEAERR